MVVHSPLQIVTHKQQRTGNHEPTPARPHEDWPDLETPTSSTFKIMAPTEMSEGPVASKDQSRSAGSLDGKLILILAGGAGLAVANPYYCQPMLAELAGELRVAPAVVTAIPVAALVGNTLGVIFLAPLGDKFERRSLIVLTTIALALALVGASVAMGLWLMVMASFSIGLFSTVAQQIIPLSVHIAPPASKGRTLGFVTGGILLGILLSRAVSGNVTEWWGWRTMFLIAGGAMFAMAGVFTKTLPRVEPTVSVSYGELIASLWSLLTMHRALRAAILIQASIFAAFLAFWANLALLFASESYQFGPSAAGLMALIGAAGVAVAPAAGLLADRRSHRTVICIGAVLVVIAFALMIIVPGNLWVLAAGVLVMDVGVQSSQVANQARVLALDAQAQSRLNTVFISTMLLGGAIGAALGGVAFSFFDWRGTCAVGALAAILALTFAALCDSSHA